MDMSDIFQKLPMPFNLYRLIVNSDHLHFGFWPDEKPGLTMEEAQQHMFEKLISFLPEPPARVLDVGCGLGLSAYLLALRGYVVTAIAPSSELIEYARQRYGDSSVDFKALDFLGNNDSILAKESFDVLFFQESMQYLSPLDKAIKKARYLLKDSALIVIGDEVCYDSSIKSETAVHMATDYTVTLSENGFRIMENQKLGKNVTPTCDFVINGLSESFSKPESTSLDTDARKNLPVFLNGWKKQKTWYLNRQMGYEIFITKKDRFFIRQYHAGDEREILLMFKEAFNVDRSPEHWNWKFRDNPYGSYNISEAFSDEGVLVTHYAGYPVPFYSAIADMPGTFLSYQIGDTMTRRSFRNIGTGKTSLLARTANHFYAKFCKESIPFTYGFNTGHIKKLGMRYLGYKYIDPVTFWTKDIMRDPFKPPKLLSRLFSGLTVEEVHHVTDEWDSFFDRVCASYKLLVKRDANYLRWRYINCPDKVHRIFTIRRKGRLTGWSVFTRKENRLVWGDALFDRAYPESVPYLLYRLLGEYFSGTETIEGWFSCHPEWWSSQLKKIGFSITPEPDNLTPGFATFERPSLLETLQAHFYYTMGDSDLF